MKANVSKRRGFTMLEILVVIGIIAVLLVATIFFLSPAQLSAQGRDSNRLTDVTSLNQSIALYHETDPAGNLGTAGIVYVSIPDPTATTTAGTDCSSLGLPALVGATYHCASVSNYRKTDGTGWVPINFFALSQGRFLPTLPIDPINTTSSNEYYIYVTNGTNQFEIASNPEAAKTIASNNSSSYTQGNNLGLVPMLPTSSTQYFYVVDSANNRIEKFDIDGNYVSQFGSLGTGNAQFNDPDSMVFNSSGDMYVTDRNNNRVEEFDSNDNYVSQFGSLGTGNGQLSSPLGITLDSSENVYVVDSGNDRVEKFSPTGTYILQFGSMGSGNSELDDPYGVAIDSSNNIWVSDSLNNRMEKFSSTGSYISQFGSAGAGNSQFNLPEGIIIDSSGNIYVADVDNNRIEKFHSNDSYISQFGSAGTGNGQFEGAIAMNFDTTGNIYVADTSNGRIQKFSSSEIYISHFGSMGSGSGQLDAPTDVVFH